MADIRIVRRGRRLVEDLEQGVAVFDDDRTYQVRRPRREEQRPDFGLQVIEQEPQTR